MIDWTTVAEPWKVAFEQAWSAYCADAIPIGAAIVSNSGEVVASGRNTVRGVPPTEGLYGNKLCHAEVNALLRINERNHRDYQSYTLVTTMEPCPLCFGALVMSKLRHCNFAARDEVAGSAKLADASGYLMQRDINFGGPYAGLEEIQIALLSEYIIRRRSSEAAKLLGLWGVSCPRGVLLGRKLYSCDFLPEAQDGGGTIADVVSLIEAVDEKLS